ncbi:deoxyribonuclease [Archaeoglobales archaeon]|nr:MAG: deoxyribonuclease [Archaeoglobales archaeon]
MKCFDTHIHSEGRSVEDLTAMANEGIKAAITCAFYPIKPMFQETLIDLFRKLIDFEKYRGKKTGMEIHTAIGIHPRCIPPTYTKVLEMMEGMDSTAFGEIGLEDATQEEIEVFESQLKLAIRVDKPCIIHTPRNNKKEVTKKTFGILEKIGFPETLAVIDHVSLETVETVLKANYIAGLTVQPGKLREEEVVTIVEEHGFENFILNSDTGFSPSDMFAVVKTVNVLIEKFDKKDVKRVAWENGMRFFRI